jgi:hypothetical protein
MSQSLTIEHFDETMRAIADALDQQTKCFDKIDERLGRIEHIFWDGERLVEVERRLRVLAEQVGRPDLATPITRSLG